MEFEKLKQKANTLPLAPGVYIMRDKSDDVIYVGKAKKLKNRVSQYFQNTHNHSPKTRQMVSKIHTFEVIVAESEFEALVLECSLIKRYMPRYNILLKDDKGYPYLRIDPKESYPRITMVNRVDRDGAEYYGPFGSRSVTQNVLQAINTTLKLPTCSRNFPRDIGKDRPCLNYHMNQCVGWCQNGLDAAEYKQTIDQARQLLSGNFKPVANEIRGQMQQAAEDLNFELAAGLRDKLSAIEKLGLKQLVTAGSLADTDVIGFAQTQSKACFTVLHFSGGNLLDKDYEIHSAVDDPAAAVSSLIKQYYLSRGFAPRIVLLPIELEDTALFQELLEQTYGRKVKFKHPKRGDNVRLVELAHMNAIQEAERVTTKQERFHGALNLLSKMLSIPMPVRIESFDISNISGTDVVGGMVVFKDGKPLKSSYKRFKIQDLPGQDDYSAMSQMLERRFKRLISEDNGFDACPDLILIDGGIAHTNVALGVLQELGLNIPVFGMVKDDRHRTRALVTSQGQEIRIDNQQSVFALIGSIQEETHRFAISYHKNLRSKRLRYSQLDAIDGIGPKRKQDLLKAFQSISAIRQASLPELERVLPKDAAASVYYYFRNKEE